MGSKPAKIRASEADWESAPEDKIPELIDGDLYLHSAARPRHAVAISQLLVELGPYLRDKGPKGWKIYTEMPIGFGKGTILIPDLVGWRHDRAPRITRKAIKVDIAPDWVCEGISPSTARLDRGRKREIYAAAKVGHLWFADPATQMLEILQLDGKTYRLVATAGGDERGRFAPFDRVMDLGVLWEDVEPDDVDE